MPHRRQFGWRRYDLRPLLERLKYIGGRALLSKYLLNNYNSLFRTARVCKFGPINILISFQQSQQHELVYSEELFVLYFEEEEISFISSNKRKHIL